SVPVGVPAGCRRSRCRPSDSLMALGSEPIDSRFHSSHGAGARAMLITHRSDSEVFQDDDCTFTTAQSPSPLDERQVVPDPLNPAVCAAGPTTSRSAALRAVCAVMDTPWQTPTQVVRALRQSCALSGNSGHSAPTTWLTSGQSR